MRMKLSVQFQGEEGIDAGGVSREWYQVQLYLSSSHLTSPSSSYTPCGNKLSL